jgi:hypothetical protein
MRITPSISLHGIEQISFDDDDDDYVLLDFGAV